MKQLIRLLVVLALGSALVVAGPSPNIGSQSDTSPAVDGEKSQQEKAAIPAETFANEPTKAQLEEQRAAEEQPLDATSKFTVDNTNLESSSSSLLQVRQRGGDSPQALQPRFLASAQLAKEQLQINYRTWGITHSANVLAKVKWFNFGTPAAPGWLAGAIGAAAGLLDTALTNGAQTYGPNTGQADEVRAVYDIRDSLFAAIRLLNANGFNINAFRHTKALRNQGSSAAPFKWKNHFSVNSISGSDELSGQPDFVVRDAARSNRIVAIVEAKSVSQFNGDAPKVQLIMEMLGAAISNRILFGAGHADSLDDILGILTDGCRYKFYLMCPAKLKDPTHPTWVKLAVGYYNTADINACGTLAERTQILETLVKTISFNTNALTP